MKYNPVDFTRVDEYTVMGVKSGQLWYECAGCGKLVVWREFEDNKGYCADCRDGKNEAYYRALHA